MTTATLLRQLRILEIIIICILVKYGQGKSLKTQQRENERIKRGYSYYGANDFGSSVHVSSGVLQFASADDQSHALDSSSHLDASTISADHSTGLDSINQFDTSSLTAGHTSELDSLSHLDSSATNGNSWSATGQHTSGYDVWLEPLPDYHGSSAIDTSSLHTSSIAGTHPGSDHITNSVFSGDSTHSAHIQLPSSDLHTQISSSSSANIGGSIHDHGAVAISDNIDFGNVADVKGKHYSKSYGK